MKAEESYRFSAGGIELNVRASAKTQLELTARFRLRNRGDKPFTLPETYGIDAYFVLPTRMHLSASTYPIANFYQDFVAVLRLREPKIFYKSYFSRPGTYLNSPLFQIEQYLAETSSGKRFENADFYLREVKMFALSFERYVQKRTERAEEIIARRRIVEAAGKGDSQALVERYDYFRRVLKVFRYWRRIVTKAEELPKDFLADLKDTIRFADEFCLKVFLRAVLKLLSSLQNSTFPDGPLYQSTERRLLAYHRLLVATCRRSGYVTASGEDSIHVREQMLFHYGWLKRRINAALYLNLRTKPLFSFQKHVGAMVAAAIAGAWAGLLSLMMNGSLGLGGKGLVSQNATIIVLALTLGYVLKDRIKELGRDRFKNFFNLLPDHVNEITYAGEGRDERPLTIGEISETAYFTEKTEDADIQAFFRDFYIDLTGNNGEKKLVIRYIQTYTPNPRTIAELPSSMDHLHETMRYDIESLVSRLDSPFQDTLLLKDGKVEKVVTPKNYSIGLVLKLSHSAADQKLVTLKVVINRGGIQRIEPLRRGDTF